MQLCLCVFVYLSGIYSTKSTMFPQSWIATLFLPPTVCACMHAFVCRLFVQRLATETFSSLRTKLHSGYPLSRQPQSLSGTGSVFTLTYTLTPTHTHRQRLRGTPDSLKNEAVFSPSRYKAFCEEDPTARLKENPRPFLSLCPKFKWLYYLGMWVRMV